MLYATKALDALKPANDDQRVGVDIIRKAIQAPLRQIVANAAEDGAVVVGKLLEKYDTMQGYDAQTGSYVNMFDAGIVDPTKVVRTALEGASSIGALLITTEAMVADKPEEECSCGKGGAAGAMPGMGGMGGMY